LEFSSVVNSTRHFFTSILRIFYLKKLSCLQTLRIFYMVTSHSKYPSIEIIFLENQDDFFFLQDLGL
jgi:hypothetical protein